MCKQCYYIFRFFRKHLYRYKNNYIMINILLINYKILYFFKFCVNINLSLKKKQLNYFLHENCGMCVGKSNLKLLKIKQEKKNLIVDVNILQKQLIVPKFQKFQNVANYQMLLSLAVSDLEDISGMRAIIYIRKINNSFLHKYEFVFRRLLYDRFHTLAEKYDFDLIDFINIIYIFIKTKELDIFLNKLQVILTEVHWGEFRNFLSFLEELFNALWYYMKRYYRFAGFLLVVSGKLGRDLLTRGHTVRLRYGITTTGMISLRLSFKYITVSTYSGVFGISAYVYYY